MTEVLTLMLLVYPGALFDVLYKWMAESRYDDDGTSDIMRMAKYFIISGTISLFTLAIMSYIWTDHDIAGDIYGALEAIQKGWHGVQYVFASLVITLMAALVRVFIYDKLEAHIRTRRSPDLECRLPKDAWNDLLSNPDINLKETICAVFSEGELVTCGMAEHLPSDINRKPAILLTQSEYITEAFKENSRRSEEEKFIGKCIAEYVMLDSQCILRFYRANMLLDHMADYISSLTRDH